MDNPKSLFNTNTKVCENCKSPLPYDYKENLCPRCLDLALFREVKEFIIWKERSNYSSLLLTFDLYFFSTSVRNLSSSSAFISTFSSGDLMTIS